MRVVPCGLVVHVVWFLFRWCASQTTRSSVTAFAERKWSTTNVQRWCGSLSFFFFPLSHNFLFNLFWVNSHVKWRHWGTKIQIYLKFPTLSRHVFVFYVFFSSFRLPVSLKTAWWNWWRSSCLKSLPTCVVSNLMMPSSQVHFYILSSGFTHKSCLWDN